MIKNKNIAKLLLIVGILCSILGVSYALFIKNLSGTNNNSLTATCFNVTFTDQNNIGLTNTYPLLDEEGRKLTPYEFTVTNNCDTLVKYDINLEVLNTSTLTNMGYIKLMLDDGTPALVSKYSVTTKTLSNASSAYKIKSDLYLDAKESKTYKLRLWLDENVTTETEGVQNKSFASKITVNASYAEELPKPTAVEYITTLAQTDTTNLAADDYGNTRYIGANPNNYVRVEGEEYTSDVYYGYYDTTTTSNHKEYSSLEECTNASSYNVNCKVGIAKGTPILWRIIGVMKNIDDGTGNKEDRVKIIRTGSIGEYSWDTSDSSINLGRGVNEWSQADLMKLLNPGYESETVGGSLYWNNKQGTCYITSKNAKTNCDFTSTGIKEKLKNMLGNAVWNTGSQGTNDLTSNSGGLAKHFYTYERSTNTGKICTSGTECNDTVERTTTWTGKVGLMYLSDYGYATGGGSRTDRATCLNKELLNWSDSSVSDCKNNDWLYTSANYQWTISPFAYSSAADGVFGVYNYGNFYADDAYGERAVRPVGYLLSNTKVLSGDGSSGNPFILS